MTTKFCTKCQKDVLLEDYYKDKVKRLGVKSHCKSCMNAYFDEYKVLNKEINSQRRKFYRTKKLSNGLCSQCKEPRLRNHSLFCELHYIANAAKSSMGICSNFVVQALKAKLQAQNYECPYVGELLVLGINAQLDHIKPRSRFPELIKDLDNIEWVSKSINLTKQDRTKEEFIDFCKKISRRFSH